MHKWKSALNNIQRLLIDDKKKNKIVGLCTYATLCAVSLVMTVLNILTDKGALTLSTAVFFALCGINILLSLRSPRGVRISMVLFSIEVVALFTFFLISGNPEGFSAIWICMLPSLGMVFLGRERGSLLCLAMFLIMAFLLWTGVGQSLLMYDYTGSFRMRFPVLFASFYVLAMFLESLRQFSYREMIRLQSLYKDLSAKDPLTQLYNRQGMYSLLQSFPEYADAKKLSVVMFDIDFFKKINDTYGHNAGDAVLRELAQILDKSVDEPVCRWGGEEFLIVYADDRVTRHDLDALRERISAHSFFYEETEIRLTVSIGVCESEHSTPEQLEHLIEVADAALYQAKNSGRNRLILLQHEVREQDGNPSKDA